MTAGLGQFGLGSSGLGGSGVVFSGSGSLAVPEPTIGGAGAETFAGSGSLAVPEPAIAGSGAQTFAGTGSLAIATPTVVASGALTFAGAGALVIALPDVGGAGSETFAASGDLAVPEPTIAGTGVEGLLGSGSLDLPEPTIGGVGSLDFVGSGSLAVPAPTIGGTGSGGAQAAHAGGGRGRRIRLFPVVRPSERRARPEPKREPDPRPAIHGRGALQLAPPTLDGQARYTPRSTAGRGSLRLIPPAIPGRGRYTPRAIAGVGRLRAPLPIADAAAAQRFRADGLLVFPTAAIDGAGHAPFAQIRVVEGLQEAERQQPASDLEAAALRFRDDLLRQERSAATEMVRAYGDAWVAIRSDLERLLRRMADARARGEPIGTSWLFQAQRLEALEASVEAQIARFARYAEDSISKEQSQAIYAAQHNAEALLGASLGPPPPGVTVTFASAPTVALQHLVGFLQDGAPLYTLLDTLGPEAAARVKTALTSGLVRGQNPRAIAAAIRQDLGGNLVRALTIARTETLRAYRTASLATYAANRDVVEGWIWHAELDLRTCPFCWANHGKEHPLSEAFASHPNCRCAPIPKTKSWAALGFSHVPETRKPIETGPEAFAKLADADQLAILGPGKFAAYQDGTLDLEDLVGFRHDPVWGPVGFERSLRDVLASSARQGVAA